MDEKTSRLWTRRRFVVNGLRAFIALGAVKGIYNTTEFHIRLERTGVNVAQLPGPFEGFKIALLSDFHSSFVVGKGLLSAASRMAMGEKPDVILLGGDFISGSTKFLSGSVGEFKAKYLNRCLDALSALEAPMGIYAVLGNHDFWSGPEAVEKITDEFSKRLGVVWLRNSSATLERGVEKIDLLGIDDYWEESSSLEKAYMGLDMTTPKILLSHNPDINEAIDDRFMRIDLTLSGHTHGGQVVAPFIGMPFIPSPFGQKYRAGLVRDGKRQTYVTRGVGHLLAPIRLNCPPEVTLITLKGQGNAAV